MNNEPVAWMDGEGGFYHNDDYEVCKEHNIADDLIPLYTHPVKELTERIRKLETALQGWEIGFEKMGYERLLKDKDEYIAELLKEPVKELTYADGIEECAQRAEAYAYMSPNFTALAEELRAILRKANTK